MEFLVLKKNSKWPWRIYLVYLPHLVMLFTCSFLFYSVLQFKVSRWGSGVLGMYTELHRYNARVGVRLTDRTSKVTFVKDLDRFLPMDTALKGAFRHMQTYGMLTSPHILDYILEQVTQNFSVQFEVDAILLKKVRLNRFSNELYWDYVTILPLRSQTEIHHNENIGNGF